VGAHRAEEGDKMKKLFYGLSSTRSFAKLLSVLAVAALGLSLSFTDEAGGFPGTGFGGGFCCSSEVISTINFGDTLDTTVTPSDSLGAGFFDLKIDQFNSGNTVSCEYSPDPDKIPFTPAVCVHDLTCHGFQQGTCAVAPKTPPTIQSLLTCQENWDTNHPTLPPAPGCEGTITVTPTSESNLSILPANGVVMNIGGNENLANCGTAYPKENKVSNPLDRGVIGSIKQVFGNSQCTGSPGTVTTTIRAKGIQAPGDPSSVPTAGGRWVTQENEAITGSCDSHIFNTTCGGNQGTTWFEVPASALTVLGLNINTIVNNLQTLQCGIDGAPTDFKFHNGNPQFKCPSCTNVQAGQPGEPLNNDNVYVLTQTAGAPKWSAVCPLILTP